LSRPVEGVHLVHIGVVYSGLHVNFPCSKPDASEIGKQTPHDICLDYQSPLFWSFNDSLSNQFPGHVKDTVVFTIGVSGYDNFPGIGMELSLESVLEVYTNFSVLGLVIQWLSFCLSMREHSPCRHLIPTTQIAMPQGVGALSS
jgi:hypothetical protein